MEQFTDPALSVRQLEIKILEQLEISPLVKRALVISECM